MDINNTMMVNKSWEECLKDIGDKDAESKFSEKDFIDTRDFFLSLSKSGHEFCKVETLMNHLQKQRKDRLFILKTLIANLPLIWVSFANNEDILIDAETLYTSPSMLFVLMNMHKRAQKS